MSWIACSTPSDDPRTWAMAVSATVCADRAASGGDCPRGLAELGAGPYLGLDLVADRFDMAGDIGDLNPKLSGFFGDLRDGTLGDIRHDEPPLIAAPPTSGPVYRTSVALVISPGLRNL